jgi:hypothetical protein
VRRLVATACAAAVLVPALGACSSAPGELSAAASRQLAAKVEQIRRIAATGSYAQLQSAVNSLKKTVERDMANGSVSASRGAAIEDAADKLVLDARPKSSPTPRSTPTSESPSPSESATPTQSTSQSPGGTPSQSSSPASSSSSSPGVSVTVSG